MFSIIFFNLTLWTHQRRLFFDLVILRFWFSIISSSVHSMWPLVKNKKRMEICISRLAPMQNTGFWSLGRCVHTTTIAKEWDQRMGMTPQFTYPNERNHPKLLGSLAYSVICDDNAKNAMNVINAMNGNKRRKEITFWTLKYRSKWSNTNNDERSKNKDQEMHDTFWTLKYQSNEGAKIKIKKCETLFEPCRIDRRDIQVKQHQQRWGRWWHRWRRDRKSRETSEKEKAKRCIYISEKNWCIYIYIIC